MRALGVAANPQRDFVLTVLGEIFFEDERRRGHFQFFLIFNLRKRDGDSNGESREVILVSVRERRMGVASEHKVSSRIIGMNPSIQTEARCYQVTMSHRSRRLLSNERKRANDETNLLDDVVSRHRHSRFPSFLVDQPLKYYRWITCENLHH